MAKKAKRLVEFEHLTFDQITDMMVRHSGKSVNEVLNIRMKQLLNSARRKSKVITAAQANGHASAKSSTYDIPGTGYKALSWITPSGKGRSKGSKSRIKGRHLIGVQPRSGGSVRWFDPMQYGAQRVGADLFAKDLSTVKEQKADYKRRSKIARDARGIGPRQFVEMGKDLGITVTAPAYVMKANYKGKTYVDRTYGKRNANPKELQTLEVKTTSSAAVRQSKAFNAAIAGSTKNFLTAVRRAKTKDVDAAIKGAVRQAVDIR